MASQLDIANWALMLLGEKRVSSLSDDRANAENILAGWDMVRDAAIARQAWNCHIERASLAADSTAPEWGYEAQYTLAGDVVRVLVQFESARGAIALCNTITSGRLGRRIDACATSNLIVIPNPCLYRRDSYADLLCHELQHVNGWEH